MVLDPPNGIIRYISHYPSLPLLRPELNAQNILHSLLKMVVFGE
jgi:hypothetical protein